MSEKAGIISLFIALLLSAALSIPVSAEGGWEFQEGGIEDTRVILMDVCFIDENHGWVVGNGSTIIATDDGGETWVKQECPVPYLAIEKVQFINEDVGYCCGTGYVFSTKDGGETWRELETGYDHHVHVPDLFFIDEDTGWVLVSVYRNGYRGHILHTTDGGETWEDQFTHDKELRGIYFADERRGWAIGCWADTFADTDVLRTDDGGETWEKVGEIRGYKKRIYAASRDVIWAWDMGSYISTDGGLNWTKIVPDSAYVGSGYGRVVDMHPVNEKEAFVVFGYWDREVSTVKYTDDAGKTFTDILTFPRDTFLPYKICAVGGERIWMVSLDRKIVRYDSRSTHVTEDSGDEPGILRLDQNTPNPFNASTAIGFSLRERRDVELTVYDVTGRKVAVLLSGVLPPGRHCAVWDGRDGATGGEASSGVYFYELRAGNRSEKRKMLLVR